MPLDDDYSFVSLNLLPSRDDKLKVQSKLMNLQIQHINLLSCLPTFFFHIPPVKLMLHITEDKISMSNIST